MCSTIGVLFMLVWSTIEGAGLDGLYSIYQGHLFFQNNTYVQYIHRIYIYICIWSVFVLLCPFFSLRGKWDLGEPYPQIIPRTIPPIHTPEKIQKGVQELLTLQACLKALAKSMQVGPVLRATQYTVCPQAVFYSNWRLG